MRFPTHVVLPRVTGLTSFVSLLPVSVAFGLMFVLPQVLTLGCMVIVVACKWKRYREEARILPKTGVDSFQKKITPINTSWNSSK